MIDQKTSYSPTEVSPPGETLRELLDERGISQAELANRMGRPQKTVSEIINGKAAVTTDTALGLELVLGVPASFWLTRESNYRESLARAEMEERLTAARKWAEQFPVRHMERLGWIPRVADWRQRVKILLEYFGVASAPQWDTICRSYSVAFRRPKKFKSNPYALSAWLREGVRVAYATPTLPFDKSRFLHALLIARQLTREPPEVFVVRLPETCAKAGVVVAFVPELPGSRASGATRWLTATRALIQLSLRYKTDDHLWFSFFHEAAHVLLHSKKSIFIESGDFESKEEQQETEANNWAADFLVPRTSLEELVSLNEYTRASLVHFADKLGIAPGVLVGRLQHEGLFPHSHCNDLKRRLQWVYETSTRPDGAPHRPSLRSTMSRSGQLEKISTD
jgi:HTH-type transcriptional regulator/antitoxin HigA